MCEFNQLVVTKDIVKKRVRDILDEYLEANNHRKTSERYAILDAVYDMKGHFSLEELGTELEARNFRVSRATLYNTMRLFIDCALLFDIVSSDKPSMRLVTIMKIISTRYVLSVEQ